MGVSLLLSSWNGDPAAVLALVVFLYLSFADDLLIFTEGNIESVQCVLQVLKEFEMRSGLAVSMQKTSFFASGLSDAEINTIQASTGMACGNLPFRHLGVPMNSRKLSLSSCEPLHVLVLIICAPESVYSQDQLDMWHIPVERKY